jgi:hypothetical protein
MDTDSDKNRNRNRHMNQNQNEINSTNEINYPSYLLKLKELLTRSYEKDLIDLSQSLNGKGQILYSIVKVHSSTKSIELAQIDVRILQAQYKRFSAFVKKLIHDLYQDDSNSNSQHNNAEPCYYNLSNLECFEQLMQPISIPMNNSDKVDEPLSPTQFKRLYELCINHDPVNANQMLQACLSLRKKTKDNTQFSASEQSKMVDYYEQCFIDVFKQGVNYDLKTVKVLLRPSSFCLNLKKLELSYEQTREILFEHLKNSRNLCQESFENKLSICNTMMRNQEDKKEFLRLIFQDKKGQIQDTIDDMPELAQLFEKNITLSPNPIVAIELNKKINIFKHEFSWEDDLITYLNYLLPTINKQANDLGVAHVMLRDHREKIILLVQSIDNNPAQTHLLIDVIETCLSLYKERMKPNFKGMPDPGEFELKDLGFDITRVILKVKLDNDANIKTSFNEGYEKEYIMDKKLKI